MRFLPVFLDLKAGPVVLIGAGELLRAKLRVLAAAGARVRLHATDGNHDLSGVDPDDVRRIAFEDGDPLTTDLAGVIAVVCAGAGDLGVAMSVRSKALGATGGAKPLQPDSKAIAGCGPAPSGLNTR